MDPSNVISESDKKIWKKIKRNGNFSKTKKVLIRRTKTPEENHQHIPEESSTNPAQPGMIADEKMIVDQMQSSILFSGEQYPQNDDKNETDSETETNDVNPKADMEDFREDLKNWALKFQIKHTAINSLLSLLKSHIPDNILPKDARTLVGTPRNTGILSDPNIGGEYWHYGLRKILMDTLSTYAELPNKISLNINIDGLPTFKSSTTSFWPILVNVHELKNTMSPLVVGVFCGTSNWTINNMYNAITNSYPFFSKT